MHGSVGSGGRVNDEDVDGLGLGERVCVRDEEEELWLDEAELVTDDDDVPAAVEPGIELVGLLGGCTPGVGVAPAPPIGATTGGGAGACGPGAKEDVEPAPTCPATIAEFDDEWLAECEPDRADAVEPAPPPPIFGFTTRTMAAPITATDAPIPTTRRAATCLDRSFWPHRFQDGGPGAGPHISLMPHSRQSGRISPGK